MDGSYVHLNLSITQYRPSLYVVETSPPHEYNVFTLSQIRDYNVRNYIRKGSIIIQIHANICQKCCSMIGCVG